MSSHIVYWGLGEALEVDDSVDFDALSDDEIEIRAFILDDPLIRPVRG